MNGYKILKCFRKEKRVSGELPCLTTGFILTVHSLSCTAETLSLSISQQLIMTQTMLTGAQKSKAVMCMPVETKTLLLLICSHGSFNYAFFSTLCAIVGHFATFEGCPLHPSNEECFVGEPQISVLNSSNCCKMISLINDI